MPKLSDNRILQQAIEPAILDRESYADAVSPKAPEGQQALALAQKFPGLRGKRLDKLTADELETARLVLIFAEQWESGYADANPGEPHKRNALAAAKRSRELRLRLFGQTRFEAMVARTTAVPLQDLLKKLG